MKRFLVGLLCALSLAVVPACGGDDDDGGAGIDSGGGGPSAEATAFCTQYGTVCEFGGTGYADQGACETAYDGYADARQTCVEDHLEFAAAEADGSAEEMMHCGHAAGAAPCN